MSVIRRIHVPLLAAEDVIPHLGAPHHWKEGRSAKCLTDQWWLENDLPPSIRAILCQATEWRQTELLDAFVERCTNLGDGRGSHSQSDLLAIVGLGSELGVLCIEAKVDEGFDRTVADWLKSDSPGKRARLTRLCQTLRLQERAAAPLRYQLLHRTVASIIEAKRYRASHAAMIVQSWSSGLDGFDDFVAFFAAVGVEVREPGVLSDALMLDGVQLRTAWSVES